MANDDKRGLASADEETRERVAKAGGEARKEKAESGEAPSYEEIGHMGGEKVKEERGSEFYHDIGKKGGEARKEKAEKGEAPSYEEIGRIGGESKKDSEED